MKGLTIGQVANEAGVAVETVRFYERRGLIEQPKRPASGYRRYPAEVVAAVGFIRHAKDLGFSLNEIADLMELQAAPVTGCADIRARAEAKIEDIEAKLQVLGRMREALLNLVHACSGSGPVDECPILGALHASKEQGK